MKRKTRSEQIKIFGTYEIKFHCKRNKSTHFTYEKASNLNDVQGKNTLECHSNSLVFFPIILET